MDASHKTPEYLAALADSIERISACKKAANPNGNPEEALAFIQAALIHAAMGLLVLGDLKSVSAGPMPQELISRMVVAAKLAMLEAGTPAMQNLRHLRESN
ncbi:MAG: hypothetical protein KF774_17660 [Planctomyces sp.]|nr:hypothetical protein [Planctomyces sp.]